MSRAPAPPAVGAGQPPRIATIDIVRGIAVLGIFVINLPDMALPEDLVLYPGPATGCGVIDRTVLLISEVLFAGKVRGLFAIIFGASAAILIDNLVRAHGAKAAIAVYYRRLFWLGVFGLINAYLLLWWGDIILKYALLGALLLPLRYAGSRVIFVVLSVALVVLILKPVLDYRDVQQHATAHDIAVAAEEDGQNLTDARLDAIEAWEDMIDDRHPSAGRIADDVARRDGGYLQAVVSNAPIAVEEQTVFFLEEDLADILFYMTLGMLLVRWGFFGFTGWSARHLAISLLLISIGLAVHAWANIGLAAEYADPLGSAYYLAFLEPARVPFVLGYIMLLTIIFHRSRSGLVARALAATGRMALTHYLAQSIVGAVLFFGFGFALFNALCRIELVAIFVAVAVFQVIFSVAWMRYFMQGPFEWLWRSLTAWRLQRLWRRGPSGEGT